MLDRSLCQIRISLQNFSSRVLAIQRILLQTFDFKNVRLLIPKASKLTFAKPATISLSNSRFLALSPHAKNGLHLEIERDWAWWVYECYKKLAHLWELKGGGSTFIVVHQPRANHWSARLLSEEHTLESLAHGQLPREKEKHQQGARE